MDDAFLYCPAHYSWWALHITRDEHVYGKHIFWSKVISAGILKIPREFRNASPLYYTSLVISWVYCVVSFSTQCVQGHIIKCCWFMWCGLLGTYIRLNTGLLLPYLAWRKRFVSRRSGVTLSHSNTIICNCACVGETLKQAFFLTMLTSQFIKFANIFSYIVAWHLPSKHTEKDQYLLSLNLRSSYQKELTKDKDQECINNSQINKLLHKSDIH